MRYMRRCGLPPIPYLHLLFTTSSIFSTVLKIVISIETISRALVSAGADIWLPPAEAGVPERLVITVQGQQHIFAIRRQRRAPYPNELARLDHDAELLGKFGNPLLIADHVTRRTGEQLSALGWSWADSEGNMDIRARGLLVKQRQPTRKKRGTSPSLPLGPSSLRLIRWLASRPSQTWRTSEMAAHAGVSASTASQVMRRLASQELADRASRGQWHVNASLLLSQFLRDYAGPGGESRYFFFAGHVAQATRELVKLPVQTEFAVSGDVGADLYAPWRAPTHTIIYASRWFEIPPMAGLVAADSLGSANVILVVPEDETIFPSQPVIERAPGGWRVPLAHPTQIMWDLTQLGGEDRLEALRPIQERLGVHG